MSTVRCLIRKISTVESPEEKVRQHLLRWMVEHLGYPTGLLAVEKALDQMPHLSKEIELPDRRADIVCFRPDPDHGLWPLLLIECKAVPLTEDTMAQAVGYNYFVKAKFVAIANLSEVKTGYFDPSTGSYRFIDGLPAYKDIQCSQP